MRTSGLAALSQKFRYSAETCMEITILTPPGFSFRRTVLSHGWCALRPFEFDKTDWSVMRVLDAGETPPVTVKISARKKGLAISTSRRLKKSAGEKIARDVRHMFRLDDDLREFYRVTSSEPDFAWIAREGAGRLLRSPTVFEDLVKMICTTNCSWAATEKMVSGLVNELGCESDDGRKSFPTAAAMACRPEKFFRDKIRAGYRSSYLRELAQRVASGTLDVESWLATDLTTKDLMNEIKSVKGAGNYSAENLLKLIGRYDGLALDSWTRAQFARARNHGRIASDKKIARFYSRFDSWRGLALWCDMTSHWLDPEKLGEW
jgi:3-methyladenine DNA glycosylase/8-oxoguanine DNA glycosylase